ncbi:FecR family protein [Sphingopyxis sp.]|uniref:FecR family protein n=1 Tax=Sphingopyxis sp. TaxID=1908224 RepID=UPI003D6CCF7A
MSDRETEADYWFALLRAPHSAADEAEFEAWRADPENAEAYALAEENWLLTTGVAPEYLAAHRKAAAAPAPAAPDRRWALAAALLLAVSLAFGWVLLGNRGSEPIVAGNESGELRLEDGTRVALMEGARIETKYSPGERRVFLSGGRARFVVAHDGARPFRVEAGGSETTALGTIFEVDLTGRRPVVHLVEGSVEVRAIAKPLAPLRLRPGQRASIDNDAPMLIETEPAGETITMRNPVDQSAATNLLVADGLPLSAVVDRANRAGSTKIEIADTTIAGRLVSGRFDVSDARSLARQLAAALDLDMKEQAGGYVLMPKLAN